MTASRTGSVLEQEPASRYPAGLVAVSVAASGWALLYALPARCVSTTRLRCG